MGSRHKYACLRGPMVHVPVIVISPSDRRLEEPARGVGGPVIHSKLDVGTLQGQRKRGWSVGQPCTCEQERVENGVAK